MGMTINTNLMASNAYLNLNKTQTDMANSMAKLSSGLRINTAADDAAGLSISQGLQSQVSGSQVASRNAQDGINVIQTAEGALGEVSSILQRMRDLAVQAGNDSNNQASRDAINTEGTALGQELSRITSSTNFNGIKLLDGSAGAGKDGTLSFQVGAGSGTDNQISVAFGNLTNSLVATTVSGSFAADATGKVTGFNVGTATDAATTISDLDTAITAVSAQRSSLGASQNRLSHAINIADTSAQNLSAAKSHITDVDMAQEMVTYTKDNILAQAGTAMLAQANQSGQGVLKLLG